MIRKVLYLTAIVLCVAIASIWYFPKHTWSPVSWDGASGEGCGPQVRGMSMKTWRSMSGIPIDETVFAYSSSEDARDDFESQLKTDAALIESDAGSPRSDRRAFKIFGEPQTSPGEATIIRLEGNEIRYIKGSSFEDALTFEKSWLKLPF